MQLVKYDAMCHAIDICVQVDEAKAKQEHADGLRAETEELERQGLLNGQDAA